MAEPISLNVGGTRYTTSLSTLMRYPDSMLGRMFGGDFPTAKDKDGACFIDGDGQLFRFVLNFLRRNELSLPEDFKELDLLKKEADFYQIEPLIRALKLASSCPTTDGKTVEISEGWRYTYPDVSSHLRIDAPAQFFHFLSPQLSAGVLREIDTLGGSPKFTQSSEHNDGHRMLSMGDGFVTLYCREIPNITRVSLEDRLLVNGCRLLHSSVCQESQSVIGMTTNRWFVPNSFLNTHW